MKKIVLVYTLILSVLLFTACASKNKPAETASPAPTMQSAQATKKPVEVITDTPVESESATDTPTSEQQTEAPAPEADEGFIQKEGAISLEDAINILRTFLGSYDENGNELSFDYESTIEKDGRDYYNFRITSRIVDGSGTIRQSLYGNYIISSDGIDVEEYIVQP